MVHIQVRHQRVCERQAQKKPRKVFNMQKQRLQGTEMEQMGKTGALQKAPAPAAKVCLQGKQGQHLGKMLGNRIREQLQQNNVRQGEEVKNITDSMTATFFFPLKLF